MSEIHPSVVEEGRRLLGLASAQGVPIRLIGGVAILLRAPGEALPPALEREYRDIDFVTARDATREADWLLREAGYEAAVEFNALNGRERLLFFDDRHGRQIDVFVGAFAMSHTIPLSERLEIDPVSVPLAELLLTKLQIAELNEKDVRDALALLYNHDMGDDDGELVNARRIASLCAADWGLWRTITGNLSTALAHLEDYELSAEARAVIAERGRALLDRIDAEAKTRAWKLRARIGERKRWYEVPEEVGNRT